ncbi:hypothetical protein SCCGRSA3_01010 [Marine Group I thaumarchaeote SCGC RSA3]|uniref:Uncharacterized protein n=1 Tax=Marine Group I thaumarchaeote SCGC RSA3 TaxID=1503183 RepID=A0A087RYX3_9ARCH|nr:hypothetical protein SCCGRSA3_01010 [Marine Group I thaumarchaeote SCGC RSA3]
MSVDVNSQSFKEEMIAEIKRIQNELNEENQLKRLQRERLLQRKRQ